MAHVVTLTGAAHCGKSTIGNMFMDFADEAFNPIRMKKYTTRKARANDDDVKSVANIPRQCDLVYEQYGIRYGIELEEIYHALEEGETPIIVINDIRAVEDLKAVFGSLVISIFLYRRAAVYEEFYDEERARASDRATEADIEKTAKTRYEKAQAIYRIYIENIQLFDRVILNPFNRKDAAKKQVWHIVESMKKDVSGLNVREN